MDKGERTNIGTKMANNFDKFRLLMWKNFLIQYRHKTRTIFECSVFTIFFFPLLIIVYVNNLSTNKLGTLLSFSITLSFILPIMNIAHSITIEKERQLKILMKIMGMQNWLFWSSWFVHTIITMMVFVTFIVLTSSVIERKLTAFSAIKSINFISVFFSYWLHFQVGQKSGYFCSFIAS